LAPAFVYDATQATGDEYSINFTAADTYDVVNVSTGATVVAGASYTPGNPIEFDGLRASAEGVPAAGDSFSVRSGQYQDIFGTLNKLVTALESNTDTDADSARYDATIAASLSDLDNALDRVDEVRTSVGGRLNMLTSQADQNTAYELHTQRTLSDIRDLDYAEAVSRLQNDLFVLQAAQQSFARIEGNSLFNYL
jgi:flagellar hook-associated protein 3 FlgL